MKKLSELKIGEQATIEKIVDEKLGIRLMELGLVPGEIIKVNFFAPLGDPMSVTISNYQLSLRKDDADKVLVNT
ncbi:MAG: ferrous iron transport protein A [Bacteroidia bacterium]